VHRLVAADPSIFLSKDQAKQHKIKRPLADNTMRRIARGLKKFVLDNPQPFLVPVMHGAERGRGASTNRCARSPEPTVATVR
jgi:DNA (cytosine-5)-methyltransferase 1